MADPALDGFAVNLEMWWLDVDAPSRVWKAAEAGFAWIEIWYWRNWDIEALASAVSDTGLQVAQIGGWDFEPSLADRGNHDGFEEGIREAVEIASLLGCSLINLNGPYHDPARPLDDARLAVIEALRQVEPIAAGAGVTLMIEPMNTRVDHPGYTLPFSSDVIAVCEAVGSRHIGINWDFYHLHITEGDLTGHFTEGLEHVAYVQIADHPGRHEPGTGEIRYEFVLDRLWALGYTGPIGLECTPALSADLAIERIKMISSLAS